jgi:hypothetical protein
MVEQRHRSFDMLFIIEDSGVYELRSLDSLIGCNEMPAHATKHNPCSPRGLRSTA